jgi:hypothetical protein
VIDYENLKLMHRHGDEWVPLAESAQEGSGHHDSTQHDAERGFLRGFRLFRCVACEEEVAILEQSAAPGQSAAQGQ